MRKRGYGLSVCYEGRFDSWQARSRGRAMIGVRASCPAVRLQDDITCVALTRRSDQKELKRIEQNMIGSADRVM
jgi:hypothetical protein